MQNKNFKKGLILFAVLVLPSIAYLLLSTGKHRFKHLPFYGPREADLSKMSGNVPDTIYHTIPDFSLYNQEGKKVSLAAFENKFLVVNFFFATCPGICPKMTSQLYRVQKKFPAMRDLRILSFSVNPEHDSVPVLRDYGRKHMINPTKWHLLTGDKKQIYDLARKGFFLDAGEGNGSTEDFIHSEQVALVDKDRRIRGYYDGTNAKEIDRLMDEIKVLSQEYKEKAREEKR
jgi:protein SCO1